MSNKSIETIFQIIAAVLLGVAAFFLWQGNYEGLFVASVLSSVSYFLSFRFQVKERLAKRESERLENESQEENKDMNLLTESADFFEAEKRELEKRKEEIPAEK